MTTKKGKTGRMEYSLENNEDIEMKASGIKLSTLSDPDTHEATNAKVSFPVLCYGRVEHTPLVPKILSDVL